MDVKFVYISGPYSIDPEGCTETAIDVFHELYDIGFYPFCPHLSHFAHLQQERDYEDWLQLDLAWVGRCDAVLRLPGHSPGADREVNLAENLGIPVFGDIESLRRVL